MRHHLVLKLISIVYNLCRSTNDNTKETELLIIYSFDGRPTYLNNWQDEYYFIGTFSTLFPFEDGKYLVKRKTFILLKIWAKWTIKHHSCW